jgi:hypothetical protein
MAMLGVVFAGTVFFTSFQLVLRKRSFVQRMKPTGYVTPKH